MKQYEEIETFAKDFLNDGRITTIREPSRSKGFTNKRGSTIGAVSFTAISADEPGELIRFQKARTDTKAFKEVGRQAIICFIKGRVRFPGQKSGAPFPSMLAYLGKRKKEFAKACRGEGIGDCYVWEGSATIEGIE